MLDCMPSFARRGDTSDQKSTSAPFPVHLLLVLFLTFCILSGCVDPQQGLVLRQPTRGLTRHLRPTDVAVVTYKNDTWRTGQNAQESILTTLNVNTNSFGKRMSYPVDGRVYAQPLFVPNLHIHGTLVNVVFVATEHDSVYAFDADAVGDPRPLWQTSFIAPPDIVPESHDDIYCSDIGGVDVGITGTPVISLPTHTLYVVAATKEHGQDITRLHALDITTGREQAHSPVTITASFPGAGYSPPYHSVNGMISFNTRRANQRAALLLLHQQVYIAWGSNCDNPPYYGWLMQYDASTLQQISIYATTPDQEGGGIWQSGAGLASDAGGNIYLETGEADFTLSMGGNDAGDAVLKLNPQGGLHVIDYFAPFNQFCLSKSNMDLGSAGPLLLPNMPELIASNKGGNIYVLDRNNMGGYHTIAAPCTQQERTDVDQVLQEFPPGTAAGGVWGSAAYWHGPSSDYVYISGRGDNLKAFQLTRGLLSQAPSSQAPLVTDPAGLPTHASGNPVISCNGQFPGSGIVWLISHDGVLEAFDAANVRRELYASTQQQQRDALGEASKFSVPTVANGEVFVGTTASLVIYGLLDPAM
ncbi:MAG TPA: hypothetical protein VGD98_19950 [Ktedonobacteraceae bacterium]